MTSLADRIANDWQYFDGIEEVSLTPQHPAGAAVAGVKALRGPLTYSATQMLANTIGLSGGEVTFSVWVSTMQGLVPKQHFKLTDGDDIVYTVVGTSKKTLGTRWELICRPDAT